MTYSVGYDMFVHVYSVPFVHSGSEENCVLAYQAHNQSCNSNFIINFTTSKLFSTQGVPHQDDNDEYM